MSPRVSTIEDDLAFGDALGDLYHNGYFDTIIRDNDEDDYYDPDLQPLPQSEMSNVQMPQVDSQEETEGVGEANKITRKYSDTGNGRSCIDEQGDSPL